MHRHISILREVSKFLAGLITADLLMGVWMYFGNLLPMDFAGITITPEFVPFGILFDAVLVVLLIHYGWRIQLPAISLRRKSILFAIGVLLGIVSVLHLLRLIFSVEVTISGWTMPLWLSWIGTIVTGYLAYSSIRFAQHK